MTLTPEVQLDFARLGMLKTEFERSMSGYKLKALETPGRSRSMAYHVTSSSGENVGSAVFCDDRLVQIQAERKPTIATFVRVVDQLKREFGEDISIFTRAATSVGRYTTDVIDVNWRTPFGAAAVSFNDLDGSPQLYVLYTQRNSCFKTYYRE